MPKKKLLNRIDSLFAELKEAQEGTSKIESPASEKRGIADGKLLLGEQLIESATAKNETEIIEKLKPVEDIGQGVAVPYPSQPEEKAATPTRPKFLAGHKTIPRQTEVLPKEKLGKAGEAIATPAVMTLPILIHDKRQALLEILDDVPGRVWGENERRLVEQVTDQLSLAL